MQILIISRLERLQQIVKKVQIESGMCEEQLNQTESLLQMVRAYSAESSKCMQI